MSKKLGEGFIDNYDWRLYPEAEKFLYKKVKLFLKKHKYARQIAKRMKKETSTEIFDWIDHMVLPKEQVKKETLKKIDFKESNLKAKGTVFKNDASILFPIIVSDENKTELAIKPEYLEDCIKHVGKEEPIQGTKYAPYRKVVIKKEGKHYLTAVERRGSNEFIQKDFKDIDNYKKALAEFQKRKRKHSSDKQGMEYTKKLVQKWLKKLKKERVADAFFRSERDYWQSRNEAGKVQNERQNSLGLGWGNHDHHTYRSSRENFSKLIEIFEIMGYNCRERFYAGEKAGWGAQILEHPQCDMVLFADVDISIEEKEKDFAHVGLNPKSELGTVGLWIALHGESVLQAGMHHLEARFNFDKLRKDLKKHGVTTMKPFSDFKFLRQAFTEGEKWDVEKKRADRLFKESLITKEQYSKFRSIGAIGSHLENLQRRQGYKGFNQTSVTAIIKETNPLKQLHDHKGA